MRKESITFKNYLDVEVTKDYYFNLSKAELMRMQMNEYGGMAEILDSIIKEKDSKRVYQMFEEIVQNAYGVISADGNEFEKSPEILRKFVQSEAYTVLVFKLLEDADFASSFITDIFPKDIQSEMEKNGKGNVLPMKPEENKASE